MLMLMLPPAFTAFKMGGKLYMTNIVIRDGIIYYIYLFLMSLANIVAMLKLLLLCITGSTYKGDLCPLSCRVVLHIRESSQKHIQVHTISGV
ncbi:hypothetical protein BDQ17DRAFT_122310 [Cyathus striatus]|nr:hypothetical protein BDQ17DRAFT_122310 [Cyathus striatus]